MEATMRKRVITPVSQNPSVPSQAWLDVESAAVVEVTSEDTAYPIESAVLLGQKQGWRAAKPGTQTIRLIFDEPHNLRRIRLVFDETETRRTQEFLLRWSANTGQSFREIVRQQWNFSPPETVREVEDYAVELSEVSLLHFHAPTRGGQVGRGTTLRLCGRRDNCRLWSPAAEGPFP